MVRRWTMFLLGFLVGAGVVAYDARSVDSLPMIAISTVVVLCIWAVRD